MQITPNTRVWNPSREDEKFLVPKGIVIHVMSEYILHNGKWKDGMDWLCEDARLSAHAFVRSNGRVYLGQDTDLCAWHAGVSVDAKANMKSLNYHYLGIEMLMPGKNSYSTLLTKMKSETWFTDKQIDATAELTADWMNQFSIPIERVVKHSEVSGPKIRPKDPKYDPGESFPWVSFLERVSLNL